MVLFQPGIAKKILDSKKEYTKKMCDDDIKKALMKNSESMRLFDKMKE